MLSKDQEYLLQITREGKQVRDEEGTPDARADRVLEYFEAGVFDLIGLGINPMAQTPAEWLAAHGKAPMTRSDEIAGSDDEFKGRRGGEAASNQFGTFSVHTASDKQIAFARRLLKSKDYSRLVPALKVPADLDTISKKSASALIDRLMGCPDKPDAADPAAPLASDKQMGFLRKLIAERDYFSLGSDDRAKVDAVNDGKVPTKRGASALIDVLTSTAYANRPNNATQPGRGDAGVAASSAGTTELEMGMYRKADGTLYRVYPARNGGHLLAKRLVMIEDYDFAIHGKHAAEFEYAGAAGRFVKASERMTLEEAQAFGHQFGICCMCGALLTDPESVAAGIGPICAGKV